MAAQDPTPVVPTLHSMSTPSLSKPADVATYLIRWLFQNPGNTSSLNEHEMLSYRKLAAEYQKPDELAQQIGNVLTQALERYFPNDGYTASCEVETKEGYGDDGTYQGDRGIIIAIRDAQEIAVIPLANITVSSDGSSFTTNYSKKAMTYEQ